MRALVSALITLAFLVGCSTVPTSFNPDRPLALEDFSHRAFDDMLRAHVRDGNVFYPMIEADPRFEAYIQQLNRVNPDAFPTKQERLAFWINAYNAYAIKGILDGYSPETTFGRYRYFIGRDYKVGGESINLYDLERNLLIPEFGEPRIHFAIVCASRSCPKLRSSAYGAGQLDEQLEQGARDFINDPSKNYFDRERNIAHLSMIFKWFEADFVAHAGSLINYVKQYVDDPELARELMSKPYAIKFLEYDWSLNGISLAKPFS